MEARHDICELTARHGRGTAWARHAMCESAFSVRSSASPALMVGTGYAKNQAIDEWSKAGGDSMELHGTIFFNIHFLLYFKALTLTETMLNQSE